MDPTRTIDKTRNGSDQNLKVESHCPVKPREHGKDEIATDPSPLRLVVRLRIDAQNNLSTNPHEHHYVDLERTAP